MPCIHMKKVAMFLWELEVKGKLKPEEQETYSYFTHKKQFWNIMTWLEKKGLIMVNNGTIYKKNKIYFSVVLSIFAHLCDIDAPEDFVLRP